MTEVVHESVRFSSGRRFALWTIVSLYALARLLQVFPGPVPRLGVVALHVIAPALFALVHGSFLYGKRGIASFICICLAVGGFFENLSVHTGFPFGHYYFTNVMGPKLGPIPILLALAYVGIGYVSWTVGRMIVGLDRPLTGWHMVACAAIAAFPMVAWDLSQDSVWATILRAWVWRDGGAYFGVPVSNFLGWYFTVYLIFQLFAIYLRRGPATPARMPQAYWQLALVFYAICAAGNLLLAIPNGGPLMVADATGALWRVRDIVGVSALVSIFVMGAFVVVAWVRLADLQHRAELRMQSDYPAESQDLAMIGTAGGQDGSSLRVS